MSAPGPGPDAPSRPNTQLPPQPAELSAPVSGTTGQPSGAETPAARQPVPSQSRPEAGSAQMQMRQTSGPLLPPHMMHRPSPAVSPQLPPQLPPQVPSQLPSQLPTQLPSQHPSQVPSQHPSQLPSQLPSQFSHHPSYQQTGQLPAYNEHLQHARTQPAHQPGYIPPLTELAHLAQPSQQQMAQQFHQPGNSSNAVTRPPDPRLNHKQSAIVGPPDSTRLSFPSPGRDPARANPKANEDYSRLNYAIQQGLPESVRLAVRDNWKKCLIGSEFQEAFVMNATVRHIAPASIKKAFRDFGRDIINVGKEELIGHLTTSDIDQLTEAILSKASGRFLDAALDLRLRTIEAKPLINALARAERLGYEPGDIVEEAPTNGQERVIPQHQAAFPPQAKALPPRSQVASPAIPPAAPKLQAQPVQQAQSAQAKWQCHLCNRLFEYEEPFLFHMRKDICKRVPPKAHIGFKCVCEFCGQGFSTTLGQQYHKMNKVCGDFIVAPGTPGAPRTPGTPNTKKQAATPTTGGGGSSLLAPTSHGANATPTRPLDSSQPQQQTHYSSPPSASQSRVSAGSDPYAHLSPILKAALDEELRQAEESYGEKMREAEAIDGEMKRRARLEGLKNSFGTKQSGIRKKYGVRLRERRTRAEIEAERTRMLIGAGASTSSSSSKGLLADGQMMPPTQGSSVPSQSQNVPDSSRNHEVKRSRLMGPFGLDGGSSGHRATLYDSDEMTDRTRKSPSLPNMYTPSKMNGAGAASMASAALALQKTPASAMHVSTTFPVALSDSSSDNEDIPARLPAAVRQSLDH